MWWNRTRPHPARETGWVPQTGWETDSVPQTGWETDSVPQTDWALGSAPQTDWETTTVEVDGLVEGYAQTLYCYIIAKDGNEGFVNAKFVFERQRKVGESTMDNRVKWPLWMRTNVLTNEVYGKLLKK